MYEQLILVQEHAMNEIYYINWRGKIPPPNCIKSWATCPLCAQVQFNPGPIIGKIVWVMASKGLSSEVTPPSQWLILWSHRELLQISDRGLNVWWIDWILNLLCMKSICQPRCSLFCELSHVKILRLMSSHTKRKCWSIYCSPPVFLYKKISPLHTA